MAIDRPDDDATAPPATHSDRPARQPPAETRSRHEFYDEYSAATRTPAPENPNNPPTPSEPITITPSQPETTPWEETAQLSRWMWTEYQRKWPPEDRPPVDRSDDEAGSWRSDKVRFLSAEANAELEQECDDIEARERETISPRLREVESCDPDRHLIGFEHRLKGRDRIKEKVYDDMDLLGRSSRQAISSLPDAIRYTFQYDETRYTQSVLADIARMQERGFKLDILKNLWSGDQYKGINSQWIEPETDQRFELQFHTRVSFEAKQITHSAYERLRTHQADAFEELVLEAFQEKVTAAVPVPLGATEIPDYRAGEQHAR